MYMSREEIERTQVYQDFDSYTLERFLRVHVPLSAEVAYEWMSG